jgi:hypothetical protein
VRRNPVQPAGQRIGHRGRILRQLEKRLLRHVRRQVDVRQDAQGRPIDEARMPADDLGKRLGIPHPRETSQQDRFSFRHVDLS